MKGGKQGRKRKSAAGGATRGGRGPGGTRKASGNRQATDAPKKRGKDKPEFGGIPRSADE